MSCLDKYNGGRFEETLMVLFAGFIGFFGSIAYMLNKPAYAFPWSFIRTALFLFMLGIWTCLHFLLLPFNHIREKFHLKFNTIIDILLYDLVKDMETDNEY